MRIAVFGAGAWGTALALAHLRGLGHGRVHCLITPSPTGRLIEDALAHDGDVDVVSPTSDEELAERRKAEEARGKKAFTPPMRQREVSKALRAYGKMVSSADKGGVRIVED